MNMPTSSNSEEFRVFDLFSPNDDTSNRSAPESRRSETTRSGIPDTHVNPASARDSFVFANPLFAPARSENKR